MNGWGEKTTVVVFLIFANLFFSSQDLGAKTLKRLGQSAPEPAVNHRLAFGVTCHKAHSDFEALPFEDGDLSYGLYYEYHEGIGYWQIGADFTPSIQGAPQINHIVTPRISLIIKDRFYRAGIGVLKSYISDKDDLIADTDLYYQLNFGVHFPVFDRIGMDLNLLYSIEKWRDIDFEFKDLEYGLMVDYMF